MTLNSPDRLLLSSLSLLLYCLRVPKAISGSGKKKKQQNKNKKRSGAGVHQAQPAQVQGQHERRRSTRISIHPRRGEVPHPRRPDPHADPPRQPPRRPQYPPPGAAWSRLPTAIAQTATCQRTERRHRSLRTTPGIAMLCQAKPSFSNTNKLNYMKINLKYLK